jgi:hypothetical protein
MNFIKKNVLMLAVVLPLTAPHFTTMCTTNDDDFEAIFNGLGSDAEFDEMNLPDIDKGYSPEKTVQILVDMNIVEILKQPFFLRTNPLNKRNVLDLPMAALEKRYKHKDWVLGSSLFYNETNRCYFSQHCDAITSYLGLTQDGFLNALDVAAKKAATLVANDFSFDPLDAIMLLKNGTISERQAGLMMFGEKQLHAWTLSWKLPFYYLERNYWLTQEEQDALEDAYGASTAEQRDYLQKHHLVADKIGFGDFRLSCDTQLFASNDDRFDCRVGGQITIPTAFALAQGIMGNHFVQCSRQQNLDFKNMTGYHLDEILTMAAPAPGDEAEKNQEKAFSILKDLGIRALNGVSAQLLEAPLGNSGHLGIGGYYKTLIPLSVFIKRRWAQRFMYKGGMFLEYLVPKTEQRMFVQRVDIDALDSRDYNDESEQGSFDNMVFLEEQIIDKLFPFVYNATVHPGIIFRWTGTLSLESYHWLFNLGTDTWIRTQEVLTNIRPPFEGQENPIAPNLKTEQARRLLGYQWKGLASLGYKVQRKKHTWILSLDGDYTFSQSGIGSDYTISLNLELDF